MFTPAKTKLQPLNQASEFYLDFTRGVGIHVVILNHIFFLYHWETIEKIGSVAIVTFFLLSGYLIFRAAWKRFESPEAGFNAYMIDRTARIFVPFIPLVVIVALLNVAIPFKNYGEEGVNTGPLAFIGNLLLMHDYPLFEVLAKVTDMSHLRIRSYNTAEPFWTIPVEYWTYAFFGVLMFVICRKEKQPKWLIAALLLISTPVVLWNAIDGSGNCLSFVWAWGALYGWLTVNHKVGRTGIIVAAGAALIGALGCAVDIARGEFWGYDMQCAFFFTLLFFGLFTIFQALPDVPKFAAKPIQFMAHYSYSLYLVHNTVIILFLIAFDGYKNPVVATAAVVGSHVVAIACWWLFERHHRTVANAWKAALKRNQARSPLPPATAAPSAM